MNNQISSADQKRIPWLDISKGIAIVLVIIGHVSLVPWEPYRKIIFSVHMPLFFIVAGYTSKPKIDFNSLKKIFKRLFVPYSVTFLIGILLIFVRTKQIDIWYEAEKFFWASGVPAEYGPGRPVTGEETIPVIGALWFLPCMFWAKLIFTGFIQITERCREWIQYLLTSAFIVIGYIIGQYYKIPMGIDIAFFCVGFMYAGYIMKRKRVFDKKVISIGILACGLWYMALKCNAIELSARFYRDFPFCIWSFVGAVAGSYLIFVISDELINRVPVLKELLVFCGKNSLIILCIHVIESQIISWEKLINVAGRPFVSGICIACVRTALVIVICFVFVKGRNWLKTSVIVHS